LNKTQWDIIMNKFTSTALLLAITSTLTVGAASAQDSVMLSSPKNGDVVSSPFKVVFAAHGVVVEPAGAIKPKSGHHHLVINGGSVPEGQSVPFDKQHIHFGKGQTETTVDLPPGDYSLTAQFANGAHQSYGKALSHTINVTVK
jgi:hypothetical protein